MKTPPWATDPDDVHAVVKALKARVALLEHQNAQLKNMHYNEFIYSEWWKSAPLSTADKQAERLNTMKQHILDHIMTEKRLNSVETVMGKHGGTRTEWFKAMKELVRDGDVIYNRHSVPRYVLPVREES